MNAEVSIETERNQPQGKETESRQKIKAGYHASVCTFITYPNHMATRKKASTEEIVTPTEVTTEPTAIEVAQEQPTDVVEATTTQPEEVQATPEPETYMVKENSRHLVTTEEGIGPFVLYKKTEKNGVVYLEFSGYMGVLFAEAMFFKTR